MRQAMMTQKQKTLAEAAHAHPPHRCTNCLLPIGVLDTPDVIINETDMVLLPAQSIILISGQSAACIVEPRDADRHEMTLIELSVRGQSLP